MKAIICGALLALTITTANAAENINSANYILPHCKAFIDGKDPRGALNQGICSGSVEALA
jgi:hypothetical protein